MNRILTILLLCFVFHVESTAQSTEELVQSAYKLQVAKKHEEAKTVINEALNSPGGDKDKLVWHVRGFVFKDLFVKNRASGDSEDYRKEAVASFLNSMKYDKEDLLLKQNEKALEFLAISHFNDASDIISKHNPDDIKEAERNYEKYRSLLIQLNPDTVLTKKDIEYFLAMSTAHRKIYESDRETYDSYWSSSNDYLEKVLDLDPESFSALYSKGVSLYNRGAFHLERLPYVDIRDFLQVQSESMRSIEAALPFMLRAYEVDSTKIEAVRALKIIHFNLNKEEETKFYDSKLKELD
jgi:hypothetical protein